MRTWPLRIGVFLLVVWTLAASFAFADLAVVTAWEKLSVEFGDGALDGLALSTVTGNATSCQASGPWAAEGTPPVLQTAYRLGVATGSEAKRREISPASTTDVYRAEIEARARVLGIASPPPFTVTRLAEAFAEYLVWVETDAAAVARGIAQRYGPEACFSYKLGALWGQNLLTKANGFITSNPISLRYYAKKLGLAPDLIRLMVRRPPQGTSGQIAEARVHLVVDVTERAAAQLGHRL